MFKSKLWFQRLSMSKLTIELNFNICFVKNVLEIMGRDLQLTILNSFELEIA